MKSIVILLAVMPFLSAAQSCHCLIAFIDGPDVLCEGELATLSVRSNAKILAYNWSTSATTKTIQISKPGRYFVFVIDANGCVTKTTKIIDCDSPRPRIYPNPSTGVFTVDNADEVTVFDYVGREIRRVSCGSSIDLSEYPSGLYVVNIDGSYQTIAISR